MGNLLQVRGIQKSFGPKLLFSDASFSINEGEHVGVIGQNGAGKTTLFRALIGTEELDQGEVTRSRGLRLGYLAQHDSWEKGTTVEDYLSTDVLKPIWELKKLALGLGLTETIFRSQMNELSGGYQMRCKLLKLIGQEPNLMLLDEPSNYLDLESLIVLENFLQDYRGAFLLISHDREFLRRTTDHILEIENCEFTKFNGSLDDYFEQKELLAEHLQKQALSAAARRAEIQQFVDRFRAKASKAKQVQSRLKALDKMETITLGPSQTNAKIRLPDPISTGKAVVTFADVDLGYNERPVLSQIGFQLQKGDHLGVVGRNGAGKSTFLKGLAGDLQPLRGEVKLGHQVSIGYFAQHVSLSLREDSTVLAEMARFAHPDVRQQEVLDLAGSLLFSGDDVQKSIRVLSGGEKSRVSLGQVLLKRSPCLLLDEPTNHLDFETVEALGEALHSYPGTVVVVSHDRGFIDRVSNRIVEIRQGEVNYYPGSYSEYLWSLKKGMLAEREESGHEGLKENESDSNRPANQEVKFNFKEKRKEIEKKIRKLEKELSSLHSEIEKRKNSLDALNTTLINGEVENQEEVVRQLSHLQLEIDRGEEAWFAVMEAKEAAELELRDLLKMNGA